jgi:ABC-type dipeptide/oligopeptide/nickel transport system permease subunit
MSVAAPSEIVLAVLKKKSAIAGIALILVFALLGGLADVLSQYDPRREALADAFALPEWAAPPNVPRNIEKLFAVFQVVDETVDPGVSVEYLNLSSGIRVRISGVGRAKIVLKPVDHLYYPYDPARSLSLRTRLTVLNTTTTMPWYNLQIFIINTDLLSRNATLRVRARDGFAFIPRGIFLAVDLVRERVGWLHEYVNLRYYPYRTLSIVLPNPLLNRIQYYYNPDVENLEAINAARELLLERDTRISLLVNITYYCNPADFIMRCSRDSGLEIYLEPIAIRVFGKAFGILGTNHLGQDVWSQFLHGARGGIILGLSVATMIIFLGFVVGLVLGFKYGSIVDHIGTFISDNVMFIPTLPLILAAGLVYGRSLVVIFTVLILLSWPGTARVIRNWTVALREAPFVEAARCIGAGTWRILLRHIAPQLIPYLVYRIVMGIPSVIMIEAALQLIGFGDPTAPTWGRMIGEAYREGAFLENAWWWFGPPILGIIAIALGFVLLGVALDEVVNPRLRRR